MKIIFLSLLIMIALGLLLALGLHSSEKTQTLLNYTFVPSQDFYFSLGNESEFWVRKNLDAPLTRYDGQIMWGEN